MFCLKFSRVCMLCNDGCLKSVPESTQTKGGLRVERLSITNKKPKSHY